MELVHVYYNKDLVEVGNLYLIYQPPPNLYYNKHEPAPLYSTNPNFQIPPQQPIPPQLPRTAKYKYNLLISNSSGNGDFRPIFCKWANHWEALYNNQTLNITFLVVINIQDLMIKTAINSDISNCNFFQSSESSLTNLVTGMQLIYGVSIIQMTSVKHKEKSTTSNI
ncbi:hypothetical protein ACTA71_012203 [Dictyostelium dimigraforme]